ncbi:D-alanyl-D-alanine carboxypeptidase [Paenibacillus sp. TRM 82003]|nr:D-alanyl-D-alanine carboxypeptidase [Paenibacillus sp. TRM 82003]
MYFVAGSLAEKAKRSIGDIARYRAPQPLTVHAEAAVVLDEDSGETLFAKAADKPMFPASMTKLVTALIALESCAPDEVVAVGDEAGLAAADESVAGLRAGDRLTALDLTAATLLRSGNDAARTLARHIAQRHCGRTMSAELAMSYFAELMTWKAQEMGATATRFVNPHGLHDPRHVSTAADLGTIARRALRNEALRRMVARTHWDGGTYANRNLLVQPESPFYYPRATGLKTGYTSAAGYCLASSASSADRRLVAIVLRSTKNGRWTDARKLLDHGFRAVRA